MFGKITRKRKVIGDGEYTVSEKKRENKEEKYVHRPIVTFLRNTERIYQSLIFMCVPNQLLRNSALRKIFHALGVRSGATDLIIPISGGRTIWLELKYGKGKMSEDQVNFRDDLIRLGHIHHVIEADNGVDAEEKMMVILKQYGVETFKSRYA
jgi:hypothetical protein